MSLYYASTSGTSGGAGTIGSPWDIATALANGSQTSGDTLYLRGGTYYWKGPSSLTGGTVQSYTDEWAVIDGYVATTLNGAINNSQHTITVTDGSAFPTNNFEVVIDDEVLSGCTRSGNSITCDFRGASGSDGGAQAHANGAAVVLAGPVLTVSGSGTTYRDFEVTNSYPNRTTALEHARGIGISVSGDDNNFINQLVHDNGIGMFTSSETSNTLIYGSVIYNNGSPCCGGTGYHGMNLYLENGAGYSRIYEALTLNSLTIGVQLYGATGPYVGGDLQGVAVVGSGAARELAYYNLVYGPDDQQSPTGTVNASHFYHQPGGGAYSVNFGYGSGIATGTFTNNYLGGGDYPVAIEAVDALTFTGNKIFDAGSRNVTTQALAYTWNNNTYYSTSSGATRFIIGPPDTGYNFANWKTATGFDASSSIDSGDLPDEVIVRANSYETGRANIFIYAASAPSSINVNLSTTGLTNGQSYVIKNAFNWYGSDVASGTYNASSPTISISLTGAATTVATPTGMGVTAVTTAPDLVILVVVPGALAVSSLNRMKRRGKVKGTFYKH